MTVLRPYQLDIIQSVSYRLKEGNRRILIQLETGGGKTVIAGFLTLNVVGKYEDRPGCLCLYLVHRKELISQVVNTLEQSDMGHMVGVIQAGRAVDKSARLQVASVQTLARRIDEYKDWLDPHVVFIDEAHHIRANTWEMILSHYNHAYFIGLTATPARLDGKGLGKHFDCMVQGWSTADLVKWEYLANMDCYSIPSRINLDGLQKRGGDYSKKQLKERSNKKFRADIIDAFTRHCMDRKVIHYASGIDDSLDVRDRLRKIGVNAAHIDGKTPAAERDSIIEAFASGRIQVLTNVEIVTEGFDVPDCDAIILSRKTASAVLFRQMIGRARRPKKDGRNAILLDLVGNLLEHDHPDEQPVWDLDDGLVKKDEEKRKASKMKTCSSCGYLPMIRGDDGWECPQCGGKEERKTVEDIKMELIQQKQEEQARRSQQARKMRWEVRESLGDPKILNGIVARYGVNPYIKHHWERIYQDYWNKEITRRERKYGGY